MEAPQAEMEEPQVTYTNDYMKLIGKLSKIMKEMGSVPKDGFNKFQNYSYVTEDALIREVRGRLAAAGLFIPAKGSINIERTLRRSIQSPILRLERNAPALHTARGSIPVIRVSTRQ